MKTFQQFIESQEHTNDTRAINAILDLAKAAAKIFSQYSLATRKKAWEKLTSKKGQNEIAKILKNPKKPLNQFKKLIIDS
jgi:Tfp pilus assembly protein FimT